MTQMKRLVNSSQISKDFNLPASCLPTGKVGNEYLEKINLEGISFVQTFDAIRAANRDNVLN